MAALQDGVCRRLELPLIERWPSGDLPTLFSRPPNIRESRIAHPHHHRNLTTGVKPPALRTLPVFLIGFGWLGARSTCEGDGMVGVPHTLRSDHHRLQVVTGNTKGLTDAMGTAIMHSTMLGVWASPCRPMRLIPSARTKGCTSSDVAGTSCPLIG